MAKKSKRSMKVVGQSGYKYRETPTITLKGLWLADAGFSIGDYVTVSCEDGRLVITPDIERAAMAKAEAEFMEREMKSLQKKFAADGRYGAALSRAVSDALAEAINRL